jgi:hypothetical protein
MIEGRSRFLTCAVFPSSYWALQFRSDLRALHTSAVRLETALADCYVFSKRVANPSALRVNHLIALSAARHPCLYSDHCKLATAHFNVWGRLFILGKN